MTYYTIFIDFDGTILDISSRYYSVYARVTQLFAGEPVAAPKYWRLRRAKVTWPQLLRLSKVTAGAQDDYLAEYVARIEAPAELARDACLPGAVDALRQLHAEGHRMYLTSLRRDRTAYLRQVGSLALTQYFTGILSDSKKGSAFEVKAGIISSVTAQGDACVVGDTEADVLAGKHLNMITVAVMSGIRNRLCLQTLSPDFLVEGVHAVPRVLGSTSL